MPKSAQKVRVRIAPSPTGLMHIGTARTALFNWLFARRNNGTFILRIEDTDRERSKIEFEKDILENLAWLGLNWDEGPDCGGPYTPYRQSERGEIYKKYLADLLSENKAYWCFCPKEELEAEKQAMVSEGIAPKYGGRCAKLAKKESEKLISEGKLAVIRVRMSGKHVEFNDLIRGKIKFDPSLMGDIVIAKNLDSPLYNFSATVDDACMKITHVIRGEDHITNTPKQIILQKALGFPSPIYAHLPLILAPNKSKLSKRLGETSIRQYRVRGYLPEAISNFMVLLGWHPSEDREILTLNEATEIFDIVRVQKSGAVFSEDKLDWFNTNYIRRMSGKDLAERLGPFISEDWQKNPEFLEKAAEAERERLKTLSDFKELAEFFFKMSDYPKELLIWKEMSAEQTLENLKSILEIIENGKEMESKISALAEVRGRGEIFWPLRAALSGKTSSPGPIKIIGVIGK